MPSPAAAADETPAFEDLLQRAALFAAGGQHSETMGVSSGAEMSSQPAVVTYAIDTAMSRFTIRVFAGGLLSGFGHNPTIAVRGYSGTAQFAPEDGNSASLHVSIQPDSLSVADDVSDSDRRDIESRMKKDVLETAHFPEIKFDSTEISATRLGQGLYRVAITGDLLLHGVQQRQTFNAQLTASDSMLRGHGEFSIRQSDFDIKLVAVAGGALKVKDEVKVTFDILARKSG